MSLCGVWCVVYWGSGAANAQRHGQQLACAACVACAACLSLPVLPFWAWMLFRTMRGVDAHSDYDLPFHPLRLLSPIYGGPRMHRWVAVRVDR
jgi:sterol desaturase/sphingolipid hydroxylase (fatty acid hydroxylase superfamily)